MKKSSATGAVTFVFYTAALTLVLLPFALFGIILWYLGAPRNFELLWYNLDRSFASALLGTSQETISSEVGRIAIGAGKSDGWTPQYAWMKKLAISLANWLNTDTKVWGVNHTKNAISHADLLDAVDNGKEQ